MKALVMTLGMALAAFGAKFSGVGLPGGGW